MIKDEVNKIYNTHFAAECYECYTAYQNIQGDKNHIVSFEDFCVEIFSNKEDMKEYLYSTDQSLYESYLENFPAIKEAYPYFEYQEVIDRLGANLSYEGNGNFLYSKYSSYGQDFNLSIPDVKPDMSNFIERFRETAENFDVDYEASLWTDEWGHGKRGAPYRLRDILDDMEECKKNALKICNQAEKVIERHDKHIEKPLTKKQVGNLFINIIQKNIDNYVDYGSSSWIRDQIRWATNKILAFENGNKTHLRAALNEWMSDIGITEDKINRSKEPEEIYKECILWEIKKRNESFVWTKEEEDNLADEILNYFAGSKLNENITDEQREIIALADVEWQHVEVDPEGPTPQQDKELDKILINAARDVLKLKYHYQKKEKKVSVQKKIFELLNAPKKIPEGLNTVASVMQAQSVFNSIRISGSSLCAIKEISDFYAKNGADVKMSKDGINWEIKFPENKKEQKKKRTKETDRTR